MEARVQDVWHRCHSDDGPVRLYYFFLFWKPIAADVWSVSALLNSINLHGSYSGNIVPARRALFAGFHYHSFLFLSADYLTLCALEISSGSSSSDSRRVCTHGPSLKPSDRKRQPFPCMGKATPTCASSSDSVDPVGLEFLAPGKGSSPGG